MTALATRSIEFELGDDPASQIRLAVNHLLPEIQIGGADVLIGVWAPPEGMKTKGGVILPDTAKENLYVHQGNVGLVLKIGPRAYKSEKSFKWFVDDDGEDDPLQLGEWVAFDFRQGHAILLGEQKCQLVQDIYVFMRMPRPDLTL